MNNTCIVRLGMIESWRHCNYYVILEFAKTKCGYHLAKNILPFSWPTFDTCEMQVIRINSIFQNTPQFKNTWREGWDYICDQCEFKFKKNKKPI